MSTDPEKARKSSFINIAFDSGIVWENQRAQRLIERNLRYYEGGPEQAGLEIALQLLKEKIVRPEQDNK